MQSSTWDGGDGTQRPDGPDDSELDRNDTDAFLETMELIAQFWIATVRLPNRNDRP